jgi:hypothetical protein
MIFKEILSVFPDYFIYVFLMLILAFRTYKSLYVVKTRTVINKVQFWVYTLTLLVAAFLLAINQGLLVFRILTTVIFVVMVVSEAKALGRVEMFWEGQEPPKPETPKLERRNKREKKGRKSPEKKFVPPALKSAKIDFILTIIIAGLSFANIFGVWGTLLAAL